MKKSSLDSQFLETQPAHKESVLRMLRKRYTDFVEDGSFVLWLDLNLCSRRDIHWLDGKVTLLNKQGKAVNVVADTYMEEALKKGSLIRKPYPNKYISQIGYRNGNQRVFGLPLLFTSFSQLLEISKIRVVWDAFVPCYLHGKEEKFFSVLVKELVIELDVTFLQPEEGIHWYTVSMQDMFTDELLQNSENDAVYDYKVGYSGNIYLTDGWGKSAFIDTGAIEWWGGYCCGLCRDEAVLKGEYDRLTGMPWNEERIREANYEISTIFADQVTYERMLYHGSLTVEAKCCADFIISSAFGFTYK